MVVPSACAICVMRPMLGLLSPRSNALNAEGLTRDFLRKVAQAHPISASKLLDSGAYGADVVFGGWGVVLDVAVKRLTDTDDGHGAGFEELADLLEPFDVLHRIHALPGLGAKRGDQPFLLPQPNSCGRHADDAGHVADLEDRGIGCRLRHRLVRTIRGTG